MRRAHLAASVAPRPRAPPARRACAPPPPPPPPPPTAVGGGHRRRLARGDATTPRAHPNSRRPRGASRRDDDLVTPQGRYPSAWATDLADIFDWDDVLEASGVAAAAPVVASHDDGSSTQTSSSPDDKHVVVPSSSSSSLALPTKRIALDGANIAWSLGTSVRARFKCRQFPLSGGIVRALRHEPWRAKGFEVVAFVPREYVVGGLQTLCDGGGRATLNAEKVKYVAKGVWVNVELMDLVDEGSVVLVDRGAGSARGRKSDDLTIIEYAKANDAWICSNDQFRDHRRDRTLGFSGARDLKAFARMRRFEHAFRVAPGLDDATLEAMRDAIGWVPRVGWEAATTVAGGPVPPPRPRKPKASASSGGGRGEGVRSGGGFGAREDAMMMEAVMDGMMIRGSEDAGEGAGRGAEEEKYDDGPRTRNDHPNALGGRAPHYAMPQEILPVFFEPTPTAAMIAAKKSFMNRQGWKVQTTLK